MNFTHLHVHSHYSMLDGMAKISDLVKKSKRWACTPWLLQTMATCSVSKILSIL